MVGALLSIALIIAGIYVSMLLSQKYEYDDTHERLEAYMREYDERQREKK